MQNASYICNLFVCVCVCECVSVSVSECGWMDMGVCMCESVSMEECGRYVEDKKQM